jgi:hypothetical protein
MPRGLYRITSLKKAGLPNRNTAVAGVLGSWLSTNTAQFILDFRLGGFRLGGFRFIEEYAWVRIVLREERSNLGVYFYITFTLLTG